MKKAKWIKHHKWFGIIFCFFMLMFCISGIVLNHRTVFADINISRNCLPATYHFDRWNNGLLRGTVGYSRAGIPESSVLLYGNGGIWLTDTAYSSFSDFNAGLPKGADFRNVRGVVQTPDMNLFAAAQFGIYRFSGAAWNPVLAPAEGDGRFTDITLKGDTVVVASRSRLYLSIPPYSDFTPVELKAPAGYDGKVSLFRTVWLVHSGEMFGLFGKLLMDGVAVVFIILCVTGLLYWLLPKYMKKARRAGREVSLSGKIFRTSFNWHNLLGRRLFYILLFVTFTGWCLRPPVLIALVKAVVPPVPGSSLDSPNPWNDKLRMIRYDDRCNDWLVSTSEGFYSIRSLESVPVKLDKAPPVSVMGLNVFRRDDDGRWLCGSFSGLFRWDRSTQSATDYFTGEPAPEKQGPPFGKKAVSGYCRNYNGPDGVVEYYAGSGFPAMPETFSSLPMSLWNLALEVHTGRIYTILGPGTLIYIFFAGLAAMWCLWTGWKVRVKGKKK